MPKRTPRLLSDASFIGTVQDVSGTSVSVALKSASATGLSFVRGESYRIGQVGSFVRIPLGYTSLFGIVSRVGASAAPAGKQDDYPWGSMWIKVELVGERGRRGKFERGISQHPTINDTVHVVADADLREIYGPGDSPDFVEIGQLANAESIPALININRLVTRHSAIVGTTGAGKTTTVAGLLTSITDPMLYPSARVVIFDIHGEYASALSDRASVFRVGFDEDLSDSQLYVPFWALNFEEFADAAFGKLTDQQAAIVSDKVVELKRAALKNYPRDGIEEGNLTADSPIPFCLNKLWFDLHVREHRTFIPKPGGAADEVTPAYVVDAENNPIQLGDAMSVIPPLYRTVKTTGGAAERVQWGSDNLGLKQQLAVLASKLRDPQFGFMFNPEAWRPALDGAVKKDLDALIQMWVGGAHPISILDMSGAPSSILNELVGATLRILYDALFWARKVPEGGKERPILLVLEEAHSYLSKSLGKSQDGPAPAAVRRIAKEGRKYGVGLMLVSQRPSEIDSTILSQCGTIIAMRLANETDRNQVSGVASENLKGLFEILPVLRTGEAIIVGEAVNLPIRTLIDPPKSGRWPDSRDPRVVVKGDEQVGFEGEGGWAAPRHHENYEIVMRQWRKQSAEYEYKNEPFQEWVATKTIDLTGGNMNWTPTPESSNLAGFGYIEEERALLVEFKDGAQYKYYDVPEAVSEQMMAAPSRGQFLARNVKNIYRYARV